MNPMAIKYYEVQKFSTLREMLDLAKNEDGNKMQKWLEMIGNNKLVK